MGVGNFEGHSKMKIGKCKKCKKLAKIYDEPTWWYDRLCLKCDEEASEK